MRERDLEEIIACLPRGRTLFSYYRDRYAALLLTWICADGTPVAAIKGSRFAGLVEREAIRQVLAASGDGVLDAQSLSLAWQNPHERFLLTLDRWGGDSRYWQQTTRSGYNLVLQINLHDGYRRWFEDTVPQDDQWMFDNYAHPVLQRDNGSFYRPTLGWVRMDLDFDTGEVLIEEIQSDWIRDIRALMQSHTPIECHESALVHQYCGEIQRRLGKIWDEALLSAALWFAREELGLRSVWYHTFESGCQLKRIAGNRPPRSLYSRLPRKFCFQQTREAPMFLQADKCYRKSIRGKPAPQWFHLAL